MEHIQYWVEQEIPLVFNMGVRSVGIQLTTCWFERLQLNQDLRSAVYRVDFASF